MSEADHRKPKQRHRRIFQLLRPGARMAELTATEVFVLSFLALIVVGVFLLKFLPGLHTGEELGWVDAVFMSTSAVCVTGLTVVDTETYFTPLGQAVLLLLIQLGGLGMLVLTSLIITVLGGRPSLRTETLAAGGRHLIPEISSRRLVRDIVMFTFALELTGAVGLYLTWGPRLGWTEAIWPSIFHSVSAFCNAGFSTNSQSLMEYQNSPLTLGLISWLICAGGIGFIALEELWLFVIRFRKKRQRLSVHTKLVLSTSAVLLLGAWPVFAVLEWRGVLADMTLTERLANSFFMSVTPRTAGFNSIDYAAASDSSNFLTIILMMIGGSPGSTAGGMKTTTFALLGLLAWSRLRSYQTVTFASRSIPPETIQRATGLFVIATGVVVINVMIFTSLGDLYQFDQPFLAQLFESVSAFNTVGLSMGLTGTLSPAEKWLLVLLMFVGRTGPLAIATALIVRISRGARYRLAYEDVVVG